MAWSDETRLTTEQFELAGRMILSDLPVRLEAGPWWAYRPAQEVVDYPRALLSEWPPELMVAGLAHEAAEVRFTGKAGAMATARWIEGHADVALSAAALTLLVNVVNDMRVNRLHMARYPGVSRLFRRLYGRGVEMEPMHDMQGIRDTGDVPLHHQFLDAHIHAWTERQWPGSRAAPVLDRPAAAAFEATLVAVERASCRAQVSGLLDEVTDEVLPAYRSLVAAEQEARRQAAERARSTTKAPDTSDPGATPTEDEPEPQDASAAAQAGAQTNGSASDEPAEREQEVPEGMARPLQSRRRDGAPQAPEDREPSSVRQGERRRWSRRQVRDRVLSSTGESWHPGLISYLRKGRGPQIDYEAFDYLAAVRKLEPLIRESIHGSGRRRGLAEIMDRRRHGAVDPWRRPRKQRRGDTGEIDLEHPERLITDPASAFLRGVRVAREDRQRDFASAILLDISGSMVQRGFPTKKFDRLVEAAVIFIEIHERLRIPYAVLSFSTEAVVHWRFEQSVWTAAGIPSEAAYRPRDHSQIVRTIYTLDHRETDDAGAMRRALTHIQPQAGLKSVIVITDGISSDPAQLRRVLTDLDRRNRNGAGGQATKVLAFGVGVLRTEFERAYMPRIDGRPLGACFGEIVHDSQLLPTLIRNAVDQRIRAA
ncbi:MAG: VWA domain-containing protein [Chloroflexi bacterium]|nr:VWA domain-containing protein [Chloroflexota bacterium]